MSGVDYGRLLSTTQTQALSVAIARIHQATGLRGLVSARERRAIRKRLTVLPNSPADPLAAVAIVQRMVPAGEG